MKELSATLSPATPPAITLTGFRACDDRFGDVDPEMVFVIEPAQRWESK
ncbi:hypothetical protein GGQ85_004366 [Nitrobacter vulgaris]|jgi:hypothetical protein|nr:hypothetical protein [Nitrobacter vulgaris]